MTNDQREWVEGVGEPSFLGTNAQPVNAAARLFGRTRQKGFARFYIGASIAKTTWD